jgi:hypothetical protein
MKKTISFLTALFMAAAIFSSSAEQPNADIVLAANHAGIKNPIQLNRWGDTAACFAEKDGAKTLCIFEKKDGNWQLAIDNSAALFQDFEWPKLYLDSDNSIFWTYIFSSGDTVDYHSGKDSFGIWDPVDEHYCYALYGESTETFDIFWNENNGGEIAVNNYIEDENGNIIAEKEPQYFPASWLSGAISLKDFDISRFPSIFDVESGFCMDGGAKKFLHEAASYIKPGYTYIKGIYKDGAMHFLMQRPDREKVYLICEYSSQRKINLIESAPLPSYTYLGVENFTDSLFIDNKCVTIQLLNHAGIDYIYNDASHGADDAFLFSGPKTLWADDNFILYGDHPWSDITKIDWNNLPNNLSEASAKMDSSLYAMVSNPNPKDRLHLREKADKGSLSYGKYYTGTPVRVYENKNGWAKVQIGSQQGYMMDKFLVCGGKNRPLQLDTSPMPHLFMRGEALKVYVEPDTASFSIRTSTYNMKIIGIIGDKWYHVWFPKSDEYGFVLQSDLWEGNG